MTTLLLPTLLAAGLATGSLDAAWRDYHLAGDPVGRQLAWDVVRDAGWPGDVPATVARLRSHDPPSDPPLGVLREERHQGGLTFRYTVLTPEDYDPTRRYPVRVILHGSTRRKAWKEGEDHWPGIGPFRSPDTFTVFPAAWDEAMWWSREQVENLRAILDSLRARYSIDSNRCTLGGLSDGGTGTFYHALRAPTPWASYFPLIGHPWVLGNHREEVVDGDVFAANLRGQSLYVVNGQDDPLYPAKALRPYIDLFRRVGAEITFRTRPGGHSVQWWPQEGPAMAEFRRARPRNPSPDTIVWETDDPRRSGRAFWVRILEIGEEPAPDPDPTNTVLFPDLDPPTRAEAFPRRGPAGQVVVQRLGQLITLQTRNVRRVELLLHVDRFDFTQPIQVLVDGAARTFQVEPDVGFLMEQAIRDGDPALLYAGSITVDIP